jgi:hypothetical protein
MERQKKSEIDLARQTAEQKRGKRSLAFVTSPYQDKDICTIRFRFNLDTKTYISRLRIRHSEGKTLCDIEKAGMELELSLIEIIADILGQNKQIFPLRKL